ncbi:hypothetical protein ACSBR2_014143 [Camellia fascicularis]
MPYYLKICFLYLSIFPEDQQIICNRLIQIWIVEGFANATDRKTIEEVVEGHHNELFNRSLRAFFPTSFFVCVGAVDPLPDASLGELFRRGSRLLKVLDLGGTPLETIPDEVFKLIHLKYLSLRGTKVKMVPELIGKLENLETLDLEDTYVTELLDEILRLKKLRLLLLFSYKSRSFYIEFRDFHGFKAPSQIGSLQSLQVLSKIDVDQRGGGGISIVKALGRLTQVRTLTIKNLRREDGTTLRSFIEMLSNLRKLFVTTTKDDEILHLQSLSPVLSFIK